MENGQTVEAHYGRNPAERLTAAILARFNGDRPIDARDLAAVDQLHSRGAVATRALARLAQISAGERVLDIGCGIGGPARLLAVEFGAMVTGVDLTDSFCEAARLLSARCGLSDRVEFIRGDALALPLADDSVDVVWTQHVAMNIANKIGLSGELWRVLRTGGRLALHEILAESGSDLHFPVPWAASAADSYLETEEALSERLLPRFDPLACQDATAETLAWAQETQIKRRALPKDAPPPVPALIFGPAFEHMADNLLRNLEEKRIRVVEAVFRKR